VIETGEPRGLGADRRPRRQRRDHADRLTPLSPLRTLRRARSASISRSKSSPTRRTGRPRRTAGRPPRRVRVRAVDVAACQGRRCRRRPLQADSMRRSSTWPSLTGPAHHTGPYANSTSGLPAVRLGLPSFSSAEDFEREIEALRAARKVPARAERASVDLRDPVADERPAIAPSPRGSTGFDHRALPAHRQVAAQVVGDPHRCGPVASSSAPRDSPRTSAIESRRVRGRSTSRGSSGCRRDSRSGLRRRVIRRLEVIDGELRCPLGAGADGGQVVLVCDLHDSAGTCNVLTVCRGRAATKKRQLSDAPQTAFGGRRVDVRAAVVARTPERR